MSPAIDSLRTQIERIESRTARGKAVLPFGVPALDARLPGGGLALGALHEVAGGGNGAVDGAAGALFAAGIAARTAGQVLWSVTRADLFAPALAQAGLAADRVIYVEAGDERTVLACTEEGLRHGGLGAVVAEVARLSMTASRRLQLRAEETGTIGIALRRWRRQSQSARHERLNIGYGGKPRNPRRLHRLVVRAGGKVTDAALLDAGIEFPRIGDRLVARASPYVYVPTRLPRLLVR